MRSANFLFFIVLNFTASLSLAAGISALRLPGESYEGAKERLLSTAVGFEDLGGNSPDNLKRPLNKLDIQDIPEVSSYADLEREFQYVRDTRFLKSKDPNFPRRLTWLYPDDGCYARAEMAKRKVIEHQFVVPKKVFAFGNLVARTDNTVDGDVRWWYHVAIAYRIDQVVYILDPAIEPHRPLTLEEWNMHIGGNQSSVQYAVCTANTFDPSSNCKKSSELSLSELLYEQNGFLKPEWDRLLELHRNPHQELGEFPPWLN